MLSSISLTGELSCRFEQEARLLGFKKIAGIDEAGRGPLAGPVVAAACIIEEGVLFDEVNDSKQLSETSRERLYNQITAHTGVVWAVGIVDPAKIDEVNIYQATILAMLQAVDKLSVKPDYLLVDGLKLPHAVIPSQKIIRGDALSHSIACASVLAKVTRDRMMKEFELLYPGYSFDRHKGYGTPKHLQALIKLGPSPIHRMSFAPLKLT